MCVEESYNAYGSGLSWEADARRRNEEEFHTNGSLHTGIIELGQAKRGPRLGILEGARAHHKIEDEMNILVREGGGWGELDKKEAIRNKQQAHTQHVDGSGRNIPTRAHICWYKNTFYMLI